MPRKEKNIRQKLTMSLMREAAENSFKDHRHDPVVIKFREHFEPNLHALYIDMLHGNVSKHISFDQLVVTSNSGKRRNIDAPSLQLRILQHAVMLLLDDVYKKKDPGSGKNCKKGYGINAKIKKNSILYPMKQVFYDRRDLNYWIVMDQRKCYEHVKPSVLRKAMKRITTDKWMINLMHHLAFTRDGRFPIGTPLSPFAHHVIMLDFDLWMRDVAPVHLRYADDNFSAYHTKEEMQQAKWRIANFWWYNYQIRVKRSITCGPFSVECDLCGYRFFRNPGKGKTSRNKGYVKVRRVTVRRIHSKSRKQLLKGWPSYYGILHHADAHNLILKIQEKMKLRDLTKKLRINRDMDAQNIEMRDLIGQAVTLCEYEIRQSSSKEDNWIKMLLGIPEQDKQGNPTGRMLAREAHGNYQYIIKFLRMCEREYGKHAILPLEDIEIENQCGYIFKDSTNQMKYIEDEKVA